MSPKIVYIVGGLWSANGMERVLTMKANYMADQLGYDVNIVLTEEKGVPPFYPVSRKIKIINFNINFDDLYAMPILKRILSYFIKQRIYKKRLTEYLLKTKPDITISTIRREINFINSIPDGSVKIGEIHFTRINYRNFYSKYLPSFINKQISNYWISKLIKELKKLAHFIVLTEEDKTYWPELTNISVIHNPISFWPNKISDCTSKNVIAVGRYTYQKGFDMLIEAWKIVVTKNPGWKLYIYGSGDTTYYQNLIDNSEIKNSILCMPATPCIINEYIKSSISVLSSRYEGFGMVITEAMACGLPVVSFTCPCGPKDIIKNDVDGLWVENGSITDMAKKINYLIKHNEKRIQMGKQARINVERFRLEKIGLQWQKLIESAIEKNQTP